MVVVDNLVIQNLHVLHRRASRNRADRNAMSTSAGVPLEDDVGAFVESEAVVLVVNDAVLNCEIGGGDVKSITARRGQLQKLSIPMRAHVLWPAALPPDFLFGASPAANMHCQYRGWIVYA